MRPFSLAALMVLTFATTTFAQDVRIQRDLNRMDRIDRRLDRDDTGRRIDPNVTLDNPDGVVGFDGPPSNYGEPGVIGDGPLPPGSPADSDDDWD